MKKPAEWSTLELGRDVLPPAICLSALTKPHVSAVRHPAHFLQSKQGKFEIEGQSTDKWHTKKGVESIMYCSNQEVITPT